MKDWVAEMRQAMVLARAADPGRMVAVEQIVGIQEIADRYGITGGAVHNWTRRYEFPIPVVMISNRPAWLWSDVEKWHRTRPVMRTQFGG